MKMAYIATNQKTKECYAICSADPEFLSDAVEEVRRWKKDGAVIELLPKEEALRRFTEGLPSSDDRQLELFGKHLDGVEGGE